MCIRDSPNHHGNIHNLDATKCLSQLAAKTVCGQREIKVKSRSRFEYLLKCSLHVRLACDQQRFIISEVSANWLIHTKKHYKGTSQQTVEPVNHNHDEHANTEETQIFRHQSLRTSHHPTQVWRTMFSHTGSKAWNELPTDLQGLTDHRAFRRKLKTFSV